VFDLYSFLIAFACIGAFVILVRLLGRGTS
jgi:hypothetical protein